jgi:hypothetical protein
MKREEQSNYLRIALGIQNISVSNEIADRIIETYEKVLTLKGDFTIRDAVQIDQLMDMKYKKREIDSDATNTPYRETVDEFLEKNLSKFKNNRIPSILINELYRPYRGAEPIRVFNYLDEVTPVKFTKCRNAGRKSWEELEFIIREHKKTNSNI